MVEDKDQKIARLEKALRDVDDAVYEAMGDPDLASARALLSLRWVRKLVARALGEPDD